MREMPGRARGRISGSFWSYTISTSAISARSPRSRANTPTVSSGRDRARTPWREILPKLGLKPNTPQKDAGRITEPLVWVPTLRGVMNAATAAADPLDEPPGVCSGLCGLRVLPGAYTASSVVTVLPIIMAPASRNIATRAASVDGVLPAYSTVPHSVGKSNVSIMSFIPTGMPCKGPVT